MNDELLNRIIAVAYNDASLWEKYKIYRLSEKNPEVKKYLDQYKKTALETKNIEQEVCPDEIIKQIKIKTNYKPITQNSLFDDLFTLVLRKPKFAAGVAMFFVAALLSTFFYNRQDLHVQYTQKEIEIADKEVRESLAIVANILKETSKTVEKDVLADRVRTPIQESINVVNNYLQGENKNEKIN